MKIILLFSSLSFLVLIACNRPQEEKNINTYSPGVVEARGYVVPKDSMAEPDVVPAGIPKILKTGKPKVVQTNTNVFPAKEPKVVLAGIPEIITPGQGGYSLPQTVIAIDSPHLAGIPEMVPAKDAYIKDINPENFSSFTKLQGLKENPAGCVIQDKSGNLWFSNGQGFCRYDGKNFTHYTRKTGYDGTIIIDMRHDKKGNLWFATWSGGIHRYDGKYITNFTTKEGLNNDLVSTIFEDKDGNFWIGSFGGGVSKYDGKSFTYFTEKEGLSKRPTTSIIQDKSGNIWIASLGNGVYCYNGKSFSHYTQKEGLDNNSVFCLFQDKNEDIWMCTAGGGTCRFDGKYFKHMAIREEKGDVFVFNIMQDKRGNLWFGTERDGMYLYDGKFFTHFTDKEGLCYNYLCGSFQDKSGTIWIGTDGGLSRYNGKTFTHYTENEGLNSKLVSSIMQDKSGNLWFGTMNAGVNCYDGKSFSQLSDKEGITRSNCNGMVQDNDGNFWFGTYGNGSICYDGKISRNFNLNKGVHQNSFVFCLLKDKNGNIWMGTEGRGVCRYDGKSFTFFTKKEGLNSKTVNCAYQDKTGNLWFGTARGGVNRYDGKSFTHFSEKEGLINNWVNCILQDKSNNLWFGTKGGACRYDGKSFMIFTEKDGLCSSTVNSMLQDKRGNLWFGTPLGLSMLADDYMMKLSKNKEEGGTNQPVLFKNFDYEDGFLGIGCNVGALYEDDKGTIWIGANDRLTAYHPEGDEPDTIAPNMQLTGIQLFNENMNWLDLEKKKDTSFLLGNGVRFHNFMFDSLSHWYYFPVNLTFAWNNNYLTFNFIGITLKQSTKVKYQYKLAGLDENWSALTTRTEAPYGNIPPGTYTFKVKAMNGEGYWSKEFNYTFTIRPPWWKTWWAYAGYILIILGGIGAVIYSILENQRKKIRLIINERNRIARELHDDIGAELTRITILSQILQKNMKVEEDIREKLRKISETGKKVLGSIGEIIWTMNPQKDNLDSLAAYIRRFVTEYLETNDIDLHIEFPNEIPASAISDEYRRNVFLVIKEAISNITKYSKATNVKLSLDIREKQAEFEISDNGTGFSLKEKENWGNGLRNMNQRMKDIGGTFMIKSEMDHGTLIRLTFPVR